MPYSLDDIKIKGKVTKVDIVTEGATTTYDLDKALIVEVFSKLKLPPEAAYAGIRFKWVVLLKRHKVLLQQTLMELKSIYLRCVFA